MIRKEAKARWVYTCRLCNIKAAYPDQFRAIERQQRHVRSIGHTSTAISQAFKPMTDSFRQLGLAWSLPAAFEDGLAAAIVADARRLR